MRSLWNLCRVPRLGKTLPSFFRQVSNPNDFDDVIRTMKENLKKRCNERIATDSKINMKYDS